VNVNEPIEVLLDPRAKNEAIGLEFIDTRKIR
jgi:hypothetical protein